MTCHDDGQVPTLQYLRDMAIVRGSVGVVLMLLGSMPFWSRALARREGAKDSILRADEVIDEADRWDHWTDNRYLPEVWLADD